MAAGHATTTRSKFQPTPFKLHQLLIDDGSQLLIDDRDVEQVHRTHQLNHHHIKILDGEWITNVYPGGISLSAKSLKLYDIIMLLNLWLDFLLSNGILIKLMNNPMNNQQIINYYCSFGNKKHASANLLSWTIRKEYIITITLTLFRCICILRIFKNLFTI